MKKRILITILICFLLGLFTFCALAETSSNSSSSLPSTTSSVGSTSSVESVMSSDISSSSDPNSSSETSSGSLVSVASQNNNSKTSSKSTGGTGGIVSRDVNDGEIDTSGWGGDGNESKIVLDENGNPITSVNNGKKDMLDPAAVVRKLIWLPLLLIIASAGALFYVNSKRFKGASDAKRRKPPAKKRGSNNYRKPRD